LWILAEAQIGFWGSNETMTAMQYDLFLLHNDSDFDIMANVVTLKTQ
jgi:hypothetical protein